LRNGIQVALGIKVTDDDSTWLFFPTQFYFFGDMYAIFVSSAMLFVETQRRRIRSIVENLSATQTNTDEEIQEAGEDLASELGRVLETKMLVSNLKNRRREFAMTKPSLNQQQLAELDEIINFAKEVEQKIKEFSEKSEKIAQKWQRRAEEKRAAAVQK